MYIHDIYTYVSSSLLLTHKHTHTLLKTFETILTSRLVSVYTYTCTRITLLVHHMPVLFLFVRTPFVLLKQYIIYYICFLSKKFDEHHLNLLNNKFR